MNVIKITNVLGVEMFDHSFESEREVYVSFDIDSAIEKIKNQPAAPAMYHAYSFSSEQLSFEIIEHVLKVARNCKHDIRVWKNAETMMMIFCFEDPDKSEDSGWNAYEMMQKIEYENYSLASYYEWEKYGLIVDASQEIERRKERVAIIKDVAITW
jgi:hypothetical protein